MAKIDQFLQLYKGLLKHAVPCIIAIMISGIIDIEVALNHPLEAILGKFFKSSYAQLTVKRMSWYFLQLIPAFVFGMVSDHHLRKKTLIFSQIFGLLGSLLLLLYKFDFWIVLFLGLTFNPISVARAALLDNFQKISALKVIAITFMAKNASWLFISFFSNVSYELVIAWVLPILALNTILLQFYFRDEFENKIKLSQFKKLEEKHEGNHIRKHKAAIFLTLLAFAFSETTFYSYWSFLETSNTLEQWLLVSTLGTFLGTTFTLFYKKVPHPSLIAILYLIGAASSILAIFYSYKFGISYARSLVFSMTQYCIVGGIYLPFVADVIIQLAGGFRKATGSAIFEIGDMIALFLAGVTAFLVLRSPFALLLVNCFLYLVATVFQKMAEKKSKKFLIR